MSDEQLPIGNDLMAYIGCIAGAIPIADYEAGLKAAGFAHVQVIDSEADLNAYAKVEQQTGCCSPVMIGSSDIHKQLADLFTRYNVNDYAASVKVFAVKPS